MKISKSHLEKIIAEELRLVLAENKAKQAKKVLDLIRKASENQQATASEIAKDLKNKKFKSQALAAEAIASKILKKLYPGHTLTGTVGLATAGQKLQDKMVQSLSRQRIPKGTKQFIKRAAGKIFGAYLIAELANYAIKGNWQKFQQTLAINAGLFVAFKALANPFTLGVLGATGVVMFLSNLLGKLDRVDEPTPGGAEEPTDLDQPQYKPDEVEITPTP